MKRLLNSVLFFAVVLLLCCFVRGQTTIPVTYFGVDPNNTSSLPTVTYGCARGWDLAGLEWVFINTSAGVYDFTSLDSTLANLKSGGISCVQLVLGSRTPSFASSNPSDSSCNYGNGQCDPPSDLNSNGTGTNLFFRNEVAALTTHVNAAGYTTTHAAVKIYETANEPDFPKFFTGSYDQLRRMEIDAVCIIKGVAASGATTNPYTGESCATVRSTVTSVTLTGAVDPTALVAMPSYHAPPVPLAKGQAFLYCTGARAGDSSCTHGSAGADWTDLINFHLKWGDQYPASFESTADSWVAAVNGILASAELAKPLYDTEGGYSGTGWTGPYTDADMQASYIARDYLYAWSKGLREEVWYNFRGGGIGLGSSTSTAATANAAYTQVESWMAGNTLTTACSHSGSIYSCIFTTPGGVLELAVWDNSKTCAAGSCGTTIYPYPSGYTQYKTLADGTTHNLIGGTVQIGIKPILLLNLTGGGGGGFVTPVPYINLDTQTKGSRLPFFGVDSGAANAYVITTIAPLGPALKTGSKFIFIATHANTAASTLVVDGLSAITIKKNVSAALTGGEIPLNGVVDVTYDGTNFQMQGFGLVSCSQMPALTGDVTSSAGSCTTTLANIPDGATMAGKIVATNIAAPATPASGKNNLYSDSTDKRFHDKNDAGTVGTTAVAKTAGTHKWFSAMSAAGVFTDTQPDFSDLTGSVLCSLLPALTGDVTSSAGSCATTNVNLPDGVTQAGKLVATNIAAPATPASGKDNLFVDSTDKRFHDKNDAGTIGTTAVAKTAGTHKWFSAMSAAGVFTDTQPDFSDLTGSVLCSLLPALTGDVTSSAGSCATTNVNLPDGVTQAGKIVATNVAAPSTPSSGKDNLFVDSTDKRFHDKNDAGTIGTTAVAKTAATHKFFNVLSAAGVFTDTQPDWSDLTGKPTIPRAIPFTIYNSAGLASGTTSASYDIVTVPFACTISAYNLAIDAGTITVKFWKVATGTAIPTSSNSISTSGVSISSGTAIHSTTVTDFTSTSVAANDIMVMDITAVTSATIVNGALQCDESQ